MTEHRISLTKLAKRLKDGNHSIFSASGSSLWFNCAGGLLANVLAPDKSGIEAAEGTVAHGVAEQWLRTGIRPKDLVGTVQTVNEGTNKFEIAITESMLHDVMVYVEWCQALPGKHFIETKVYYSEITPIPHQGGTADFVACSWQRMTIIDLKFGKGVFVEVVGNTQAMLYALGFFYEWDWVYDFQVIEIRIAQPRMQNMSTWTITREELLAFAEEARTRAHLAWSHNAARTPGEKQCSFCKVKSTCAAQYTMQVALTEGIFEDLGESVTSEEAEAQKALLDDDHFADMLSPQTLETEHLAKLYLKRSMFEGWWKAVHLELLKRAATGENVPSLKAVEARSKRKIKNEKVAATILEMDYDLGVDEFAPRKFVSPTALEKLLLAHGVPRRDLQSVLELLVYKPPGKPTLVSVNDRRPAIVDSSEDIFDDLDSETEDENLED